MAERFMFPLTDRDFYAGKVSFQAVETIPPSIRAYGGPEVDTTKLDPLDLEKNQATIKDVANATLTGGNVVFSGRPVRVPRDKCTLFLPHAIAFQDGVVFDEFSLGRVGAAVEAGINNGASLLNSLGEGIQQNINAFTDVLNASPTGDIARLAATRLSKIGGGTVQGGVQSALRVTTNPNKRLLFKEVNIREFAFNFKLIPVSADEARQITSIIKFFRTELYPDDSIRINTAGQSIPIGYKFPNEFEIGFRHRNTRIAHRILPAYLVSMQTTYNPTAAGFFEDGNFVETEVTLNFRESRTLAKSDVKSGGY